MKRTPLRRKSKTPLAKMKQQLWEECKRIIRKRYANPDGTWNCYTCGAHITEPRNAHTGHFIPSSICSTYLRYHLDNLRIQDYACNIHRSGNWIAYEAHLIVDHGRDFPETLKQLNRDTAGKQYDVLWYQEKLNEYKNL